MSIQYSNSTITNNILDTSTYSNSILSATEGALVSALNDIKNELVGVGWTAVLKPTGINIVYAGLPTAGQNTTIAGVAYTYRSAFSASTTLSAAITTTTATSITVTSGTNIPTGSIITVDTESMYVSAGGGTASLTVVRGVSGTTAATHSNGATVNIGCEVLIGATAAATASNMQAAIIAGSGAGTAYSTGTPAHPLVTAFYTAAGTYVNVYTKDNGSQTIGKFTSTNTGTNVSLTGYSTGTVSAWGGWWLYPTRTPVGLHGRIAVIDPNTAATAGNYGGLAAQVASADGAVNPAATSSALTISITTGGVFTASATTQGVGVTSLKVGQEILVATTPPQVFTVASVTSTTTGTVTPNPPVAITTTAYSVNAVASTFTFTVNDNTGTSGNQLKILANKYQFLLYQPGGITNSMFYTIPWVSTVDAPYKITNIATSPITGTRFTTDIPHGLASGDSVYITEAKIGGVYTYFCTNSTLIVTAIDSTNFDITSVTYPGGAYTYSSTNYAIMTPISPTLKAKITRAIVATSMTNTTGARPIRSPYTTATQREAEYYIFNANSFTVATGASASSIACYTPLAVGGSIYTTINGSYTFSEPIFALNTAAAGAGTWYQIGQFWDCFIAQRYASLDAQMIFDGKTWQNFANGTGVTGSIWFVAA